MQSPYQGKYEFILVTGKECSVALNNKLVLNEDQTEIHLFLPILPGRGEAWRRFAQELSGPRREEWSAWRERVGVIRLKTWISTGQQGAGVYLRARIEHVHGNRKLVNPEEPFERWMREQVFSMHGLDLAQFQEHQMWEPVPEMTEDVRGKGVWEGD
jgi:hypothetical protein